MITRMRWNKNAIELLAPTSKDLISDGRKRASQHPEVKECRRTEWMNRETRL